MRMLAGSIYSWPEIYQKVFRYVNIGLTFRRYKADSVLKMQTPETWLWVDGAGRDRLPASMR